MRIDLFIENIERIYDLNLEFIQVNCNEKTMLNKVIKRKN